MLRHVHGLRYMRWYYAGDLLRYISNSPFCKIPYSILRFFFALVGSLPAFKGKERSVEYILSKACST